MAPGIVPAIKLHGNDLMKSVRSVVLRVHDMR